LCGLDATGGLFQTRLFDHSLHRWDNPGHIGRFRHPR
jgi:hypothetical protein